MNTSGGRSASSRTTTTARIALAAALAMTVPASGVALAPTPAYAAPVLADVPPGTQFYSEMVWSVERGALKLTADGRFNPLSPVSRATMAEVLYNLAGSPAYVAPNVSPFSDVPKNHPSYKQIAWVASKGISTGWGDGTFRPSLNVARDAMAAFMYRLAGKPDFIPPNTSPFTDITPSTQFYLEMNWLKSVSISTGWGDGTFRPLEATARDAMAAFSFRLYNVMANQTGISNYVATIDDVLVDSTSSRRSTSPTSVQIMSGSTEYLDVAASMSSAMAADDYPITAADSDHRVLSQTRNADGTYTVEVEVDTEFAFGERGDGVAGSKWVEPHTIVINPNNGNPIILEDADDQFVPADNSEEEVVPLPPPAGTTPLDEAAFASLQTERAASPQSRAFHLNIWAAQVYASDWSSWPYGGDEKRHFNPAYGYYPNNCANFVSQILRAGELPTKGTISPFDKQAWTPNIPGINKPTRTWTQASSQYSYMLHAGYRHLSSVYRTFPGDLIYVDWDTEGSSSKRPDGLIDHVMFVVNAQISPGDEPLIVQKSPNRHMIPFNLVRARVASQDRIAHFYPVGYQHS